MKNIHKDNIEKYSQLYKSDSTSQSYEVRGKVNYLKKLLPKFKKGSNLLEIGYGMGDLIHEIYALNHSSVIYGVELVKEAKALYKKRFPQDKAIRLLTADVEKKFPFRKNFFHFIIFSHVLEHIEHEDIFMKRIIKSLRNGGALVIAVPEWEGVKNHLHFRQYSKKRLVEIGKRYNLQIVSLTGDGYFLNKAYYSLLHRLQKSHAKIAASQSSTISPGVATKIIMYIYYKFFVETLLLMNTLDTILFGKLDNKPMQWIAVYKKHDET